MARAEYSSLGLVLVGVAGALAPLAPSFGWLLAVRIVQAFGTSAAYPAGLAIFRAADRGGRRTGAALGAVSIASSVSSALGPVLGGGLVALAGWPAIFLANIPVQHRRACCWPGSGCPPTPPQRATPTRVARPGWATLRTLDLPGVVLFSGLVVSLLGVPAVPRRSAALVAAPA